MNGKLKDKGDYLVIKSDREKAIEWWNYQGCRQGEIADKHNLGCTTIQEHQIEEIWRKERQLAHHNFVMSTIDGTEWDDGSDPKPQVDFSRLKVTTDHLITNHHLLQYYTREELENVQLFFDLLSISSSFAHKSHKELNKLMK